jgi:hypothetical protein
LRCFDEEEATDERTDMDFRRWATKRTLVIGAVVLAVVVGAGAALAETAAVFDPKAEREAFEAAVADKLGVSTQELEEAYKAAALERLDAAVEAGRITEEQAKALKERIESGDFRGHGFGFFGGGPGMHHGFGGHIHMSISAAADYLGLEEAALAERLHNGESLAEVAKAEGKSVDGLESALIADAKAKLDQAVEDGRLTDAQRDAALSRLEEKIDDVVNGTGPRGHRGFGPPPGGDFDDSRFGGWPDA